MQVVEQSAMVPRSLEKGEFHVGVTQEYVATRYVAGGAKVGMIYPEDGNSIQAEGAGIIKGAKHRKEAEKLVDFFNDKKFRELVIKDQFRRPARKDLDFSKIVPMPPLSQIKLMPGYVDTEYLKDRDKILARIKDIRAEDQVESYITARAFRLESQGGPIFLVEGKREHPDCKG